MLSAIKSADNKTSEDVQIIIFLVADILPSLHTVQKIHNYMMYKTCFFESPYLNKTLRHGLIKYDALKGT